MKEEYIYIVSLLRDQKLAQLHYFSTSYTEAIKYLYDYQLQEDEDFLTDVDGKWWRLNLHKYPLDVSFRGEERFTEEKFGIDSNHMVYFKNYAHLIEEYKITQRNKTIEQVLD
jgi:hypothetical protein